MKVNEFNKLSTKEKLDLIVNNTTEEGFKLEEVTRSTSNSPEMTINGESLSFKKAVDEDGNVTIGVRSNLKHLLELAHEELKLEDSARMLKLKQYISAHNIEMPESTEEAMELVERIDKEQNFGVFETNSSMFLLDRIIAMVKPENPLEFGMVCYWLGMKKNSGVNGLGGLSIALGGTKLF